MLIFVIIAIKADKNVSTYSVEQSKDKIFLHNIALGNLWKNRVRGKCETVAVTLRRKMHLQLSRENARNVEAMKQERKSIYNSILCKNPFFIKAFNDF